MFASTPNTVELQTDKTALYLIGAVAGPIAQDLVDGAALVFNEANITYVEATCSLVYDIDGWDRDITNEGFTLSLQGSMTNVGPLDALIEFVDPVTYVLSAPGLIGVYICRTG